MLPMSDRDLAAAAAGGRRQRMSLEEVERAVLDTARALLIEQRGLTVSLEHINLEIIIAAARVPRSSAFRRWRTKEEFVVDFLCDLAGPSWAGTAAFDPETIATAIQVVQENMHLLTASVEDRGKLVAEVVRRAAEQNYRTVIASDEWRTYVALTATVASMSDEAGRERIRAALNHAEATFIDRMAHFYSVMSDFLGFKLKEPFTYWHLAATGAAVVEGLSLRRTVGVTRVDERLDIVADGQTKQWALAAAGFKAVLDSMIEIDPDYKPMSAEDANWFANASVEDVLSALALTAGPAVDSADSEHSASNAAAERQVP